MTKVAPPQLLTESEGWRAGKPVEDPEKMKRWGIVTARPSEFLVHVRKGRVLSRSSGQGASCFKWPWDAVAIVPTSLQRLSFRADQVTAERVGVEVVGLAVYRIAEPLLAYRVLNFSYPERAQQKLEETLTSMFIGATRRLVATLSVDDCLQKRKSLLAEELLREIAPVVGGEGRPEDATAQGWGVVIDTIEIQEVRVLSEKVFAAMQAPFRAALDRKARDAQALAEREVAEREADCKKQVELSRVAADEAIAARRAEAEQAEAERAAERRRLSLEEAAREAVRRSELLAAEAAAEVASAEARARAVAARAEIARAEAQLEGELRRAKIELSRLEGQAEAEVAQARALADRERIEGEVRRDLARNLPQLANAVGQKIGEVKITHVGGDGSAFGSITQAIQAVVDVAAAVVPPRSRAS